MGLGGGYRAKVLGPFHVCIKRDRKALLAFALRKETTARLLRSSPGVLPCVTIGPAVGDFRQQDYRFCSSPFFVSCSRPRGSDTCLE